MSVVPPCWLSWITKKPLSMYEGSTHYFFVHHLLIGSILWYIFGGMIDLPKGAVIWKPQLIGACTCWFLFKLWHLVEILWYSEPIISKALISMIRMTRSWSMMSKKKVTHLISWPKSVRISSYLWDNHPKENIKWLLILNRNCNQLSPPPYYCHTYCKFNVWISIDSYAYHFTNNNIWYNPKQRYY